MKKALLPFLLSIFLLHLAPGVAAQAGLPFAKWTSSELVLNNGVVQRAVQLPATEGSFLTTLYKPVTGDFKYFEKTNSDFEFEVNNTVYDGSNSWRLVAIQRITDARQGDGAAVTLQSQDKKIELTVRFLLYPQLPVIRKSLVVKNLTNKDVALESVDIEKFKTTPYYASTFSWVCNDYGRRRSLGPYEGSPQDALVILHNMDWEAGIVIGNEATGVLKRTSTFWNAAEISAGLTHKNARFPFRKWIKPGESFETPQVFTMVYNNHKEPNEILNTAVPDFIRKHMGIRLSGLKEKPTFVYNTWEPFADKIDEKLIKQLAKAAADAGMKEFVIDDGWQDSYGDWGIDKKKFPNGLKPVFEYIKSLGMKPGLWISVGSASSKSKVYREHPEWFVRDKKGKFANLQLEGDVADVQSACFSTGWKDYIKNILLKLSLEYGLEYMKLDFAVVSSAYRFNPEYSGCYAQNHLLHKDHHESMYANYEQMWKLFDELHTSKPNLFIDCTFEAMGGLQLIDYAMLKHAEGNWLSNFAGDAGPKTDLRVRNMAWWRSPAIPATALVIGNPQMQDNGWETHIQSLAGALPIMLGDPRKLSGGDLKKYRGYADWLQAMQQKHDFMSFRQDLAGFGEPAEGRWDGFQRINVDTRKGGIVGVFRQGATEANRTVTVQYLEPAQRYQVRTMDGKVVATLTGQDLKTAGFSVNLSEVYSGALFEISAN
ncbi:glycoside hydrolase family 36 protein [Hymenobacter terrenus]|uniref:glycoside hydrolase family 36 protein n=1 Tax=Hymenobacter terrenus TaxID=1629124 RepID=UPI0006195D3B|nr:glycoside hydrolase family 36 protein [Hymenobacter terrenus]